MLIRLTVAWIALLLMGSWGFAQAPAGAPVTHSVITKPKIQAQPSAAIGWRSAIKTEIKRPETTLANVGSPAGTDTSPSARLAKAERQPIARVTKGIGTLPNDHGQVWREYDIRPYTGRVTSTEKPEQAIVDWILRETGTEVWFTDPLGMLSANRQTLRVYHTPDMQQTVSGVVDRFVSSQAQAYTFGVRLITIRSPNWRTKAFRLLRPVAVQTPGIEAWLVTKEDAALLVSNLRKRTDFREHNSANLLIHNGQSSTVAIRQPRSYMRSVQLRSDAWPGYQMETGQIDEGFTLQLSPLLSLDERTVDGVVKCEIDQIEKLLPVWIDVPSTLAPRQRVQVQVPQTVSWQLHERFRWPTDQVLLISCGVVAAPNRGQATALGITNPFTAGPPRADALLLVECKGKTAAPIGRAQPGVRTGSLNFRGRY